MKNYLFLKVILSFVFAVSSFLTFAQQKIGGNPGSLNPSSILELESSNKGFLPPRVALTSTTVWGLSGTATSASTFGGSTTAADGMIVYNTATINDITPGFYVWSGGATGSWKRMTIGAANGLSLVSGNVELGGTLSKATTITQGENNLTFSGSGNSQFRLNVPSFSMGGLGSFGIDAPNVVNGRFVILEGGNVGIGTASPTEKFHVVGNSLVSGNSSVGGASSITGNLSVGGTSTVTGNSTVGGTLGVTGNRVTIRRSAVGEARYQLYNLGNSAEWLFGQKSGTSHDFTLSKLNSTTETDYLSVSVNGVVTMNNLGGSGTQMVITDNNGVLSKQAIPVNTDAQTLSLSGNTLSISGSNSSVTLPSTSVIGAANGLSLVSGNVELGGTLSKATTITQGENNLTFSGSGSSQFRLNVPSFSMGGLGTFGIDAPNVVNGRFVILEGGNVGIGTASPTAKLHVVGNSLVSGNSSIGGTASISGNATVGGSVGIGTTSPAAPLEVKGRILVDSIRINSGTSLTQGFSMGGNGVFGIDAPGTINGRFVVTNSGNVGIGTASPTDRLTVSGGGISFNNSSSNGRLRSGSTGVLNLNVGSTSLNIDNNAGDANLMTILNSGKVGIGTSSPEEKFTIGGGTTEPIALSITNGVGKFRVGVSATTSHYGASVAGDVAIENNANAGLRFVTNSLPRMYLSNAGALQVSTLGGSGTQMVVADNNGVLSKQAIPGDAQTLSLSGNTLSISGSNSSVTLPSSTYSASNGLTLNGSAFELGGTLSKATTITQGENNLTFSGSGSSQFRLNVPSFSMGGLGTFGIDAPNFVNGRFVILEGGNVGIGTANPSSKLHVNGSISKAIRRITAARTLDATDYTIIANAYTVGFTITLPAPNTCTGREYVIRKVDDSSNAITFTFTGINETNAIRVSDTSGTAGSYINTLNYVKTLRIQSDGTDWYLID